MAFFFLNNIFDCYTLAKKYASLKFTWEASGYAVFFVTKYTKDTKSRKSNQQYTILKTKYREI